MLFKSWVGLQVKSQNGELFEHRTLSLPLSIEDVISSPEENKETRLFNTFFEIFILQLPKLFKVYTLNYDFRQYQHDANYPPPFPWVHDCVARDCISISLAVRCDQPLPGRFSCSQLVVAHWKLQVI